MCVHMCNIRVKVFLELSPSDFAYTAFTSAVMDTLLDVTEHFAIYDRNLVES